MLKWTRKLLALAILCSALAVLSASNGKAQTGGTAACFAACDREYDACMEWGMGCPYPNHMEVYPSQDFWFSIGGITCTDYYYSGCRNANLNCSIQCGGN